MPLPPARAPLVTWTGAVAALVATAIHERRVALVWGEVEWFIRRSCNANLLCKREFSIRMPRFYLIWICEILYHKIAAIVDAALTIETILRRNWRTWAVQREISDALGNFRHVSCCIPI